MGDTIVGVVLAAGTSSRLGRPKQLEMVAGKPLVRHTLDHVLPSGLDDVVVVVGAEKFRVSAAIDDLPVTIVDNPDFASGQASSVQVGVRRAMAVGADAIIFLLADQPGVSAATIDRLIEARVESGALVGMTSYGGRPSHPVLFGREVFPDLLAVTGDMGGRDIVQRHRDDLVLVDGGRETVPADLDKDEDLVAIEQDLLNQH